MFKFELSEQMFSVIANALGNHPFREAAPVVQELQRQLNAQRMNGGMPRDAQPEQPSPPS